MTNDLTVEQAVGELKAMKEHIEPHMSVVGVTAYDMAIQALEQQPCEDCISREEAINEANNISLETSYDNEKIEQMLRDLPSVTPKYTDEEIDKAQAVEQAYVDKMVELAVEKAKRPKGKWIETPVSNDIVPVVFKCSECGMRVVNPYKYCPNCGAEMNGGGEDGVSD